MARSLAPTLCLLIALGAAVSPTRAAEIRVRSRSAVSFEVARSSRGLDVRGRLEDDARRGVAEREVTLTIDGWEATATIRTGEDGEFAFTLAPEDLDTVLAAQAGTRRLAVEVTWAGDTRFGPAREHRAVDVDKVDVDLSVTVVPTMVLLGEKRDVRLIAEAYAQGRPVRDLPLSVRIGDGAERTLRTGVDGRAAVALSTTSQTAPGEVPVTAHTEETADTNAASAGTSFLLVSPTAVSLDATPVEGASPAVRVTGQASDAGGPVAGALVTLVAGEVPMALAVTDAQGHYGARITRRTITEACGAPRAADRSPCAGGRALRLRATWSPAEPWRRASVSPWVDATLPAPPRVPFGTYLVALLVALALLGALQLGRLHPLRGLRAWLASRRRPAPPPATAPPLPDPAPLPVGAPPAVDGIAGVVVDQVTGGPVANATVAPTGAGMDGLQAARTDADGGFVLAPLPAGPVSLVVTAPGHLPTRVRALAPHPGRLVVALGSVRAEVAAVYRSWAEPRVGRDAFGLLTPRDIAASVGRRLPEEGPAALRVTEAFEHVYFGAETDGVEAIDRVRAAVEPDSSEPTP